MTFDGNINNGVVFVKFEAVWCKGCKKIENSIQKMENEFPSVEYNRVDIDDHPEIAKQHKILGVPTVIIFKDGQEKQRINGTFKIDSIRKLLRDIVYN